MAFPRATSQPEAGAGLPPLTALDGSTVFEMLPLPALIKDRNLAIARVNPALLVFLDAGAGQVLGRTAGAVGLSDALFHAAVDARVLAEGGTRVEPFSLVRHDGETMHGEVFKMRLDGLDGTPAGLLCVILDRTREVEAERRLADAEALHRAVVESISDAVFLLDAEGRPTFAGPRVEAIFGLTPRQAVATGSLRSLLGHCLPALSTLPRDRETRNIECTVRHADGGQREVLVSATPIEIGDSRWLVACHDVTDRVEALNRLKASMVKTVEALCATVERRDPYVVGHQQRVAALAVAIGRRLGLGSHRLEGLRLAAVVHDIGKINVPAEILNKPGKLSEHEMAIVRNHAEVGYEILKDIDFPWPIARMVREHHEALDGSGYPLGLTGDRLLLESRILSVADVLEAVTSHRPYRPGLGLEKGLEILRELRGSKLDPQAVDACLELVESREVEVPGWTFGEETARGSA